MCRLQGLRLWKSRHIQIFKIANNFNCKQLRRKSFDLCLNRNFMFVRLSNLFPSIRWFHVVSGISLGSAGWEPRCVDQPKVYSFYPIHSTYSIYFFTHVVGGCYGGWIFEIANKTITTILTTTIPFPRNCRANTSGLVRGGQDAEGSGRGLDQFKQDLSNSP